MGADEQEQAVLVAIDRIADRIEDTVCGTAEELGLSFDEVIDRVANELKSRTG